jgi:hypothetical protein
MFRAVTQRAVAAFGRLLDRQPWAASAVGAISLLGAAWAGLIAGLAVLAVVKGQPGSLVLVAGVTATRFLWRWTGWEAGRRQLARLTGDPAVYHEDWLYRTSESARGRDRFRCASCGSRLAHGAPTVEGVAPVAAAPAGLPEAVRFGEDTSHAGYVYCEHCGNAFRRRQGDETERARRLLYALDRRAPAAAPEPAAGLRRMSIAGMALSFAALVLPSSLPPALLVALVVVLFGSIFGIAVARQGWALYAENPPLLAFAAITLAGAAIAAGAGLWGKQHPDDDPGPGAVRLEYVFVDPAPPDREILTRLNAIEGEQDFTAASIVSRYESGAGDPSWWGSAGAAASGRLAKLAREHRAEVRKLSEPALRRRYAEIATATRRWAAALGRLRSAMARGAAGAAKRWELLARIEDDRAARLRATLVVRGP